jgi:hypothetical protein
MFLRPGVVLDAAWVEEAARAIDTAVLRGTTASHASVFRRTSDVDATLPQQIITLLAVAWRGPHPEQGLMISRDAYDRLGGHREGVADPEAELLRRIGRRRIVTLRSAATGMARTR